MRTSFYFQNYRKNSKIVSIFFIFLLIFLLFSSNSIVIALTVHINSIKNINTENPDCTQFIINFNDLPVSIYKNYLNEKLKNIFNNLPKVFSNKLLNNYVSHYKNNILSKHLVVKESISKLNENGISNNFVREFTNIFNGMVVQNISQSMIKNIEKISYIKSINQDNKLTISLKESISIINVDEAHKLIDKEGDHISGYGITIAVLDTGVNYNHPDLKDSFIGGYDFVNRDYDPMDDNGHGTHCAGIAVGNGNVSNFQFVGVAPKAKLYSYKVLDANGTGYLSWFIEAIEQAIDPNQDGDFTDHVDIISISAGDSYGNPNDILSMVADNAFNLGVLVVAAAGNNGPSYDTISSPGCAKNVICVGATDKNDIIASFSSRGSINSDIIKPNILAPGIDIVSTSIDGGYVSLSGTSMSCPHVAGTAALILQMHPSWSPDEIKIAIENSAVNLGYNHAIQGYGRINAIRAIKSFESPYSKLDINGEIDCGLIEIYGYAFANNFQYYRLYYQILSEYSNDFGWIKLCERYDEVKNNVLFVWDTSSLPSGDYELKLEVYSKNQTNKDIAPISLIQGDHSKKFFIHSPNEIIESEQFTIYLTDNYGVSKKALFLLIFTQNLPKIKFGFSPNFNAPIIKDKDIENIEGRVIVFFFNEGLNVICKSITLLNGLYHYY